MRGANSLAAPCVSQDMKTTIMAMSTVLLCASEARAEDETKDTEQSSPTWILGVGVSVGGLTAGPNAGVLSGVLYGAGVERRLSESLWLTGDLRASFNRFESGSTSASPESTSTSWFANGKLGLRHVLNPDDRLRFSILTSLGAFYGRSFDRAIDYGYDQRTWGMHVDGGLALDYWVAEMLALRLSSRIVSVGHARTSDVVQSTSWYAEVGISPGFSVQFAF